MLKYKCSNCKKEKEKSEFGKNKNCRDGVWMYCRECMHEKARISYQKNKEVCNKRSSEYCKQNKEKRNAYQMERHHKRKMEDPLYILKRRYRSRTRKMFRYKNFLKTKSSMSLLGCNQAEFVKYFESLFTEGMTWEKVFKGEIHIDHKIPISLAKSEEEIVKLSHHSNLQPLWASDNLKKGDKTV